MQHWYNGLNQKQRALLFICSTGLILVYGLGVLLLCILLFLEFGRRG